MKKQKMNTANIITGSRIVCSVLLLFFPISSPVFWVLYLTAGITDMIDGTVARRLGTADEAGARLDTAADFIFVAVCLVRLLPVMKLPVWIWAWTGCIAAIKVCSMITSVARYHRIAAEHTRLNKLTGFLLFLFPLMCFTLSPIYGAGIICAVATVAAAEEWHIIRNKKVV